MKTLVLYTIAILLSWNLINDKLDQTNGFENFKFGTPAEKYKNLIIEIDEGNTKLYSADNDLIHLDGVKLSFIRITFIKNKLSVISIATTNSSGAQLLKYLKTNYGEPVKVKNYYEWKGTKVRLLYEPSYNVKDASVSFYSI